VPLYPTLAVLNLLLSHVAAETANKKKSKKKEGSLPVLPATSAHLEAVPLLLCVTVFVVLVIFVIFEKRGWGLYL